MARQAQEAKPEVETVTLVSPDGETKHEVEVGSKREIGLRWDGWLPVEQQKLEAPAPVRAEAPKTVGTNA